MPPSVSLPEDRFIPSIPPPIKNGHFTFGDRGFFVKGISRVDPARLAYLMLPERQGRKSQAVRKEAKECAAKDWLFAQCKYYGSKVKSSAKREELEVELRGMVAGGKCDTVPSRIEALQTQLAAEYKEFVEAALVLERAQREKDFAALNDPIEELNFSAALFARKYFLDDVGQPAPEKLPDMMSLTKVNLDHVTELKRLRIPKLACQTSRHVFPVTLIGWDEEKVQREVRELDVKLEEAIRQRQEAQKRENERKKREAKEKHVAYIRGVIERRKGAPFRIEHAFGAYRVTCPTVEEGFFREGSQKCENLLLNIHSERMNGLEATFDFGVIEGTMFLAQDKSILEAMKEEAQKGEERGYNGDGFEGESDEEDDYHDERLGRTDIQPAATAKRKTTDSGHTLGPPSKKYQADPPKSESLNFGLQWRGRETGEYSIELETDNSNIGYIEFLDPACTRLRGVINIPCAGDGIPFQGYRFADTHPMRKDEWREYSSSVYDYEGGARWGKW